MKIKFKILGGFFVIIAMLMVAGAMSIYEFTHLSNAINALVEDNYKSIEASKNMIESLEREDSGTLLFFTGKKEEGKAIVLAADTMFKKSFIIAKSNITEAGEDTLIYDIDSLYNAYRQYWIKLINTDSTNYNIENYYDDFHSGFILAKMNVNMLLSINEQSMFKEAKMLKDKAKRALMPGLVAIITALIFMLIFNFLISHYFVNPLKNLIRSVKHYIPSSKKEFSAGVDSDDEIKELELEISELVKRIKSRKKDEN